MLQNHEKDRLYTIITAVLGEDNSIKAYKNGFNSHTVEIVEEMINANTKCNANLKRLLSDLLGISGAFVKGWLRKTLSTAKRNLTLTDLNGYGCLVSVKSRWKTAIINSTL
jgi:hypothetical protein